MELTKSTREVFVSALTTLKAAGIPFLVGGAFAVHYYTGYLRYTKALGIFLCKRNVDEAMAVLAGAGFVTKAESDHWLAKALKNGNQVDLIFGSSNWVMQVDESFFNRSVSGDVLDVPVRLLAPEEIIWSKSYVAARERFDGADIVHLVNALKGKLDWNHLLNRFGEYWQLLFADVLLYNFVYPSERNYVPHWLMEELIGKMRQLLKEPPTKEKVCRGILLDRYSFVYDVEREGYKDAREEIAERLGYSAEQVAEDRMQAEAELQAGFE